MYYPVSVTGRAILKWPSTNPDLNQTPITADTAELSLIKHDFNVVQQTIRIWSHIFCPGYFHLLDSDDNDMFFYNLY